MEMLLEISLGKVLTVQKLLSKQTDVNTLKNEVFHPIFREIVISRKQSDFKDCFPQYVGLSIESGCLEPTIKIKEVWYELRHLNLTPDSVEAKKLCCQVEDIKIEIQHLEAQCSKLSFLSWNDMKQKRALKKKKEEILNAKVKFTTFVEMIWFLYISNGLGKKEDFMYELGLFAS